MPSNPIHQSDIRLNYGLLATIFESAMEGPKEKQFFSSCIQQIQHNNPEQQQSLNHMFYSVITRPQGYRAFLNYIQDQIQKFIVESSPRDFIPSASSYSSSPYHHQAANNNLHGHYQQSSHYSPNVNHSSGHHGSSSSGAAFPVSLMGGSNGGGGGCGGGNGGNSKASPISSPRQMMNINAKQYILVTEYTFVCVFQELVLVPSSPSTATAASANARQQQQQQPQQQQQRTFTRNMFRPIQEYRLLDIFDTLDTQARGVIRMRDMYMVLVCLVARQASILTKFLYQFGEYIFQMFREIPPHYSEIPLMSRGHHHYGPSLLSTHRNVMDIDKDVYQNQNQSHNSGVIKMEHVLKLATVAQISVSRVQREMNKVIRASAPKILEKNVAATSSSTTSSSSPSNTHSSSPTVAFQQLVLLEDNYSRMISKEDFMLIYFAVFSSEASSSYSSGSSKISSTRN